MKTISSAELRNNMKKYPNTTRARKAVISTEHADLPKDFHRAISMDEAIKRVEKGMREIVESK